MPFKVIQGHRGRYQSKACMRLYGFMYHSSQCYQNDTWQ